MSLLVSGRAHVWNIAGDFRRKHRTQRVPGRQAVRGEFCPEIVSPQHQVSVLAVSEAPAVILQHLPAKPAELVVEENINQVELENQTGEIQSLAYKKYPASL